MEFRVLGKTDLNVSRLSLGTLTFGSQVQENDAIRLVDSCLAAGINFFDTANVYSNGQSETILGKALRGRRHRVVLATKVCGKMGDGPDDVGLSRAAIRKAIEGSLRRLMTDYVDLYYLHLPDNAMRIEETLNALNELAKEGKIRYPATSNYASWQVLHMLWHCENYGHVPPTVSQPMYNLLARGIEQEYLAFCKAFSVAVVPYNPLAGGLLTGKYVLEGGPAKGTQFDGNRYYQDRYWHSEFFEAVVQLQKVAERADLSLPALAFRWLLSQPLVDSVILGVSSKTQFDENLEACRGPSLPEDVLRQCDAVWEKLRGVAPRYNS